MGGWGEKYDYSLKKKKGKKGWKSKNRVKKTKFSPYLMEKTQFRKGQWTKNIFWVNIQPCFIVQLPVSRREKYKPRSILGRSSYARGPRQGL